MVEPSNEENRVVKGHSFGDDTIDTITIEVSTLYEKVACVKGNTSVRRRCKGDGKGTVDGIWKGRDGEVLSIWFSGKPGFGNNQRRDVQGESGADVALANVQ